MALTQRIELRVDDAFVDALTKLADRLGKTRAEVIKDALNYYSKEVYEWDRIHGIKPTKTDNRDQPLIKAEPCAA